ncbi:hypothetical protein ILYODFUR_020206, partial [Ilyodon furcidens]
EFVTSEVSDQPMLVKPTGPPSIASSSSTTSAAPGSPNISVEDLTSEAATDATNVSSDGSEGGVTAGHHTRTTGPTPDDVATSVLPGSIPKTSGSTPADVFQPQETFGLDRTQETEDTVRNIGKLQERFSKLEAHMVALEKQKVDWSELADLRQLNTYKDSQDASNNLTEQLEQHKALIESLMSDHEKLESLEDMLRTLMSQDRGSRSEAASDRVDTDSKVLWELSQQVSYLRKSLFKVEEDMKDLRVKQALSEERSADQHLQDQLDDLRGMLEDMILSLTSQLSSSFQDEAMQGENEMQDLPESTWRSALTSSSVNIGRKLSLLFQHYEQLQDTVNGLIQQQQQQQQQQGGGRAGRTEGRQANRVRAADSQNIELLCNVQRAILQLQAECERLQETTRNLDEDNRQKQGHIKELYKTAEELEVKKADKQMVESEIGPIQTLEKQNSPQTDRFTLVGLNQPESGHCQLQVQTFPGMLRSVIRLNEKNHYPLSPDQMGSDLQQCCTGMSTQPAQQHPSKFGPFTSRGRVTQGEAYLFSKPCNHGAGQEPQNQ